MRAARKLCLILRKLCDAHSKSPLPKTLSSSPVHSISLGNCAGNCRLTRATGQFLPRKNETRQKIFVGLACDRTPSRGWTEIKYCQAVSSRARDGARQHPSSVSIIEQTRNFVLRYFCFGEHGETACGLRATERAVLPCRQVARFSHLALYPATRSGVWRSKRTSIRCRLYVGELS